MKSFFFEKICITILLSTTPIFAYQQNQEDQIQCESIVEVVKIDSFNPDIIIQNLASLTFHIGELKTHSQNIHQHIVFEENEVDQLWNNSSQFYLLQQYKLSDQERKIEEFDFAYKAYINAIDLRTKNESILAQDQLNEAFNIVSTIWCEAIDFDLNRPKQFDQIIDSRALKGNISYEISKNHHNKSDLSYLPKSILDKMSPYIISEDHPMKSRLDAIFTKNRVTQNEKAFSKAGFIPKGKPGLRSYVQVASHPKLPGYLVKVYFDNELREKQHKPSWKWLIQRCLGAEKIDEIINKKKLKHFCVAKKCIYPLPKEPTPPLTGKYTRHLAILLVTDMKLMSERINLQAWKEKITTKHLDELYTIISYAKGSSYRPDNINYTENEKFAFIDTEYPTKGPDFDRIRKFLSHDMLKYWDKLVKNGGK
ncbi:MAG: hypothetical protein H0W88_09505 [Parachlamydiaceae bacterium]|nr:hypothetical protein [Parachlamydiaceae bacterium]